MLAFYLFCGLLLPGVMIVVGLRWRKNPPQEINHKRGFRTRRSMQNQETWAFAHAYFSKVWLIWGTVILLLSLAVSIVLFEALETAAAWIIAAQIVALLLSVLPTRWALKKNFTETGERIQEEKR